MRRLPATEVVARHNRPAREVDALLDHTVRDEAQRHGVPRHSLHAFNGNRPGSRFREQQDAQPSDLLTLNITVVSGKYEETFNLAITSDIVLIKVPGRADHDRTDRHGLRRGGRPRFLPES